MDEREDDCGGVWNGGSSGGGGDEGDDDDSMMMVMIAYLRKSRGLIQLKGQVL